MTQQLEPSRDAGIPRRPSRSRRDGGFTYVEVVITIVLMGIVVLPILAAVRGSVQAASVSRDAAEVETVLINAADRVNRADRQHFKCDLSGPAQQAALVEWGDATAITVEHEHWDETAAGGTGAFVAGACPLDAVTGDPTYRNGLVQLVRIRVTSPDGGISRQLEVVKGDF